MDFLLTDWWYKSDSWFCFESWPFPARLTTRFLTVRLPYHVTHNIEYKNTLDERAVYNTLK